MSSCVLRSPHEPLDGVRLVLPAEGAEDEEGDGGRVHRHARHRLQDQLGPGYRPNLGGEHKSFMNSISNFQHSPSHGSTFKEECYLFDVVIELLA